MFFTMSSCHRTSPQVWECTKHWTPKKFIMVSRSLGLNRVYLTLWSVCILIHPRFFSLPALTVLIWWYQFTVNEQDGMSEWNVESLISTVQQKNNVNMEINYNFLSFTFLKAKTREKNFKNMYYLTQSRYLKM